jgi:hypothetical protein
MSFNRFKQLQDDIDLSQIDFWCKRIANDIKLKVPDNQAKRFCDGSKNKKKSLTIKISYSQNLKVFVLETISYYLDLIPTSNRRIFEEIIKEYEKQVTVSFVDVM